MSGGRIGVRQAALPLVVLGLIFALAAIHSDGRERFSAPAPSVSESSGVSAAAPGQQHSRSALRGVAVALLVVGFAELLWLGFVLVRLVGGRRKRDDRAYHRRMPHATAMGFLMLGGAGLFAVLAFLGLHALLASGRPPLLESVPAAGYVQTSGSATAPKATAPTPSARRSGTPFLPTVLVLGGLCGIGVASFYTIRGRDAPMQAFKGPRRRSQARAGELSAGETPRSEIRRAYAEMCRMLAPFVPFEGGVTPREYAGQISRAGIACPAILSLTLLFELDRYRERRVIPEVVEATGPSGELFVLAPSSCAELLRSVERCAERTEEMRG